MAKKQENNNPSVLQWCSINDLSIAEPEKSTSSQEFSICVRTTQLNRRQGTVACKDRGEVNKSNKKPWKQKGTGRARAGSARSPLWRGGGIIFGPQKRIRTASISKQRVRRVLLSMLFDFVNKERVGHLDWHPVGENPKTADAVKVLNQVGVNNKKIIFFVSPHDDILHKSLSNVPNVSMFLFDQSNPFDLANGDIWIYLKRDQEQFNKMVTQWI